MCGIVGFVNYKKELPKNVRKMFKYEKGVKVKVLNSLYYGKKKQK